MCKYKANKIKSTMLNSNACKKFTVYYKSVVEQLEPFSFGVIK